MKKLRYVSAAIGLALACTALNAQTPTPPTPPAPPTVQTAAKGSLLKIDGRIFAGLFSSETNGAYPIRTLAIPDAKLRFTFTPGKDITVVNRLSLSNAKVGDPDYFYVDLNNWGGALPGHLLRVGKMKEDVGEETWTDNPAENILITNSASAVGGYDGGVSFRGPITGAFTYSLAAFNGSGDVTAAKTNAAPVAVKIGGAPADNLYLSGSYYTTGNLGANSAALKVANLTAVPTGATNWKRSLWEVDARWNYGKSGIKSTIGSDPSVPFQLAAAYGQLTDDATGAADRDGNYWYIEGLYNATPTIYLASRSSQVSLDNGATAKIADSPVAVNEYTRFSFGAGYRLTPLAHLKAEYTINDTSGGASEPKLNQFAVGLAMKF